MLSKSLTLLIVSVAFVLADTGKQPGPCPDVAAHPHFDITKFAEGRWYSASISDLPDEWSCTSAQVKLSPENVFHMTGIKNGEELDVNMPYETITPGVFKITDSGQVSRILATDYYNFAISHMCLYDASDDTHLDRVSISVREKHAQNPDEMVESAMAIVAEKGVHPGPLKAVPQTNCEH